jgi:hypothetical protein
MLINPKLNSFYFNFPKGFFSERVTGKYEAYIKKQPIPFDNVQQYVNSTIQSINIPGLSIDSVEQVRYLGKKANYKSSTPIQDLFSKDFTIGFKETDGFINYFIMLDTVLDFLNFGNPQIFIQDLPVRIMDSEGNVIVSLTFKEVIFTSFSEISFSYTANNPQFQSFSLGFKCNYLDYQYEARKDI